MRTKSAILFLFSLTLLCSCQKSEAEQSEESKTRWYVNYFARSLTNTYYLWIDEISEAFSGWSNEDDPIASMQTVRYKNAGGEDIDKWSFVTNDYSSLVGTLSGESSTLGFDYSLYRMEASSDRICMVVRFAYPGSPASNAGIKRADVITSVNGKNLTLSNYSSIITNEIMGNAACTLGFMSGKSLQLQSVKMYEDPVLLYKVFDSGSKKIGYLLYTAFTQKSWKRLIEASDFLRGENVDELILDLRYNGGGYVNAENALASMLAPEKDVTAGSLYQTSVYNSNLNELAEESNTYFKTSFSYDDGGTTVEYSTSGHNIGIKKLYAIMTSSSASASESIVVGLKPYMDVVIVGEQSYGKYCSGILVSSTDWYDNYRSYLSEDVVTNGLKYSVNWGMYLMISRFADKYGKTPCMPDGFAPDVEVKDNPTSAIPLGDPSEAMLATALQCAGYQSKQTSGLKDAGNGFVKMEDRTVRPGFGMRLLNPDRLLPGRESQR